MRNNNTISILKKWRPGLFCTNDGEGVTNLDRLRTKIFLEYDPIKNIIRRLPDSINTHSRHSLFAYNNEIFVVLQQKVYVFIL